MLTIELFESWLIEYGDCWKIGDSEGIRELFSDNAHYYETPFDDPMVGLEAIEKYWQEGARHAQKEVKFSFSGTAIAGNRGFARWSASFVRVPSEKSVEIEGFLEAEFTSSGLCSSFREWWHRKESA